MNLPSFCQGRVLLGHSGISTRLDLESRSLFAVSEQSNLQVYWDGFTHKLVLLVTLLLQKTGLPRSQEKFNAG